MVTQLKNICHQLCAHTVGLIQSFGLIWYIYLLAFGGLLRCLFLAFHIDAKQVSSQAWLTDPSLIFKTLSIGIIVDAFVISILFLIFTVTLALVFKFSLFIYLFINKFTAHQNNTSPKQYSSRRPLNLTDLKNHILIVSVSLTGFVFLLVHIIDVFYFQHFLSRINYSLLDEATSLQETLTEVFSIYPFITLSALCICILSTRLVVKKGFPPYINLQKNNTLFLATLVCVVGGSGMGRYHLGSFYLFATTALSDLTWPQPPTTSQKHQRQNTTLNLARSASLHGVSNFLDPHNLYTYKNSQAGFDYYCKKNQSQSLQSYFKLTNLPFKLLQARPQDVNKQKQKAKDAIKNKPHIVVVVSEGLSASVVGHLNPEAKAKNLTPELDKLAQQSFWADSFYFSVSKSRNSVGSLLLGLPLLSMQWYKQALQTFNNKQNILTEKHTLASWMGFKQNIYLKAGSKTNDQTHVFMHHLGMQHVYGRSDFINPQHTWWRVSDGDLFNCALQKIQQHLMPNKSPSPTCLENENVFVPRPIQKPNQEALFITLLTTSIHEPFTGVPPDRFAHIKDPIVRSIRYYDSELGHFIKRARNLLGPNTIYVITADHHYLRKTKSLEESRIPLVIVDDRKNTSHPPRPIIKVGSHADIAPTLAFLLNINKAHAFVGNNLLDTSKPGLAIAQGGRNYYFYRRGSHILQYNMNNASSTLLQATSNKLKKQMLHQFKSYMCWSKKMFFNPQPLIQKALDAL